MTGVRAAWFGLCLAAHSTPCAASLPDMVSLGPRSSALAGTGAALASDWEASYQNPAGLSASPLKLAVGFVYGGFRLRIGTEPYSPPNPVGVQIGASVPLPFLGFLKDRIGIGLGLHLPTSVVNRVNVPYPEVPRAVILDSRTEVVSVLVGIGVRLPAGFQIGGGVLALAALVGDIIISPDGTGRITSISEEQLTVDYAPVVGARWSAKRVRVGATLRMASRSSYLLRLHTRLGDAIPLGLPVISFAGIAQYDPLQVGLEGAFYATEHLALVAHLAWKNWSAYRYPIEPATHDSPKLPTPGFHDTVVPRVAAEYAAKRQGAVRLTVRGGYFFEWSPTPASPNAGNNAGNGTGTDDSQNLLDADRHVLCAGVAVRLVGRLPLELDLFGQVHWLSPSHSLLSGQLFVGGATLGVPL